MRKLINYPKKLGSFPESFKMKLQTLRSLKSYSFPLFIFIGKNFLAFQGNWKFSFHGKLLWVAYQFPALCIASKKKPSMYIKVRFPYIYFIDNLRSTMHENNAVLSWREYKKGLKFFILSEIIVHSALRKMFREICLHTRKLYIFLESL